MPRLSDVFWASQEEMRQGPMSLIFWEQFCQVPGPQICLQLEESCSLPSSEEGHKGRDEAKGRNKEVGKYPRKSCDKKGESEKKESHKDI